MGVRPEFQLYTVGMLPCISYFGYLHKRVLKTGLPFVTLIAVHVASYTAVYIYARFHVPIYEVPQTVYAETYHQAVSTFTHSQSSPILLNNA